MKKVINLKENNNMETFMTVEINCEFVDFKGVDCIEQAIAYCKSLDNTNYELNKVVHNKLNGLFRFEVIKDIDRIYKDYDIIK